MAAQSYLQSINQQQCAGFVKILIDWLDIRIQITQHNKYLPAWSSHTLDDSKMAPNKILFQLPGCTSISA